ncbi:hypothetical protein [Mycolicibacterium hippocampi]|uniref:hypothetical protein n=1 Tax=Mycolicibacterium hippocampi TaxID=659824 RepID=UPI0021F3AB95|nr:hypothetical protein [Mycolicibacterium hippocampi]
MVVITDLDSDDLGSATVTLNDAGAGDSFGWGTLPTDVSASVSGGVLTFTGTATAAEYQQLLQSVTLTSADAGIKTVTFAVVDADGNPSVVPAISVVTVVGVPGASLAPVVVATPVAAGTTDSAITISDGGRGAGSLAGSSRGGHPGRGRHNGFGDHDQPGGGDHRPGF